MSFIPGAPDLMQEAMDRKQKERENQYGNDVFRILADVADKATGGKVGGTPYVPPPYVTPPFAAPSAQSQANISAGPVQNPYLAASREMSATPGQLYPADFQQRVAANNMDDYNYNRNEMLRQRNAAEEKYAAAQEMIKAGQANLEPRPSGGFVNDTLWGAFKNRLPYSTDPVTGQARIQTPQTAGDLAGLVFSKLGNTLANIGGQTEFHHGKGNNIYRLTFDRANADRMGDADRIRQVALDQTNPAMMQKRAMLKAAIARDMGMGTGTGWNIGRGSSPRDTSMTEAQAYSLALRKQAMDNAMAVNAMRYGNGRIDKPPVSENSYGSMVESVLATGLNNPGALSELARLESLGKGYPKLETIYNDGMARFKASKPPGPSAPIVQDVANTATTLNIPTAQAMALNADQYDKDIKLLREGVDQQYKPIYTVNPSSSGWAGYGTGSGGGSYQLPVAPYSDTTNKFAAGTLASPGWWSDTSVPTGTINRLVLEASNKLRDTKASMTPEQWSIVGPFQIQSALATFPPAVADKVKSILNITTSR